MNKLDRILDKLEAQGELLARHTVFNDRKSNKIKVQI